MQQERPETEGAPAATAGSRARYDRAVPALRVPTAAPAPLAPGTGEHRTEHDGILGAGPRLAVVIAAGAGHRLRRTSGARVVKPITCLLGSPLIVRTLLVLREQAVTDVVVVTGYRAREVERLLAGEPRLAPMTVRCVRNPEWRKQNGLSVLAARPAAGDAPFLLSMADHLYSPEIVRRLRRAPRSPGELLLAVDRRVAAVPDLQDAMRVRLSGPERIRDIGKGLVRFDAVDTGVFIAAATLFEALEAEKHARGGDCALADGVRYLAGLGLARAVDIGDSWWHDVDTHADLLRAQRQLGDPS